MVSANDKIVVGFIGCGSMGMTNLKFFKANPDVEIAAVCDVYDVHLERAIEAAGGKVTPYKDFRKLLEHKDLNAVVVSTPDHWHSIPMINACQLGLDVYVEKPIGVTIAEGRAMVNAARENNRVVQVGTQQRSGTHFKEAVRFVQSGKLGKITFVRTWNTTNLTPDGIGNPPDCDPPPGLDWDMFLGPAPKRPFNPNRFIRWFRCFWDYAGGMMTDWGVHLIDVVQWAMNQDYPQTVSATGGKLAVNDNRETPDTLEVAYEYPGFILTYTYRAGNAMPIDGHGYGIQFHGTNGTLFVDRNGWKVIPEGDRMDPVERDGSKQNEPHVRNFLDCMRSREPPASDIEIAHRSTSACQLGNISYLVGRKLTWDGENEQIIGDKEASGMLSRPMREPWKLG